MSRAWLVVALVGCCLGLIWGCASTGAEQPGTDPIQTRNDPEVPLPAASEDEKEEPPVNTLKWTTASEVDNFGFDIYRGLSEDGEFERITPEILPGAGTTDEPQNYIYQDLEIDPRRDYYYYIESISLGGIREIFSPVIKAPAKRP